MNLTTDQILAHAMFDGPEQFKLLKGYAGTGKSIVLVEWVYQRIAAGQKVLIAAPTHKAVSVLNKMCQIGKLTDLAQTATIHSALGLVVKWTQDKQTLVKSKKSKFIFDRFDVVVIDECSMLSRQMIHHINRAQSQAGNTVIYVGDPAQLPPINEKCSGSFKTQCSIELTQIMRQGEGSAIPKLGKLLRSHQGPIKTQDLLRFADDVSILVESKKDYWSQVLYDFYTAEKTADVRYLAYRNKTVMESVASIRAKLYGDKAPEFFVGEAVQALKAIKDGDSIVYPTDQLLTISSVKEGVFEGLPVFHVRFKGYDYTWPVVKRAFHSDYKALESRVADKCRDGGGGRRLPWNKFHDFVDSFAWLRSAQGMTVHKSQGSTFDRVYVDASDILNVQRDAELSKKLLYVACTRPSNQLTLLY